MPNDNKSQSSLKRSVSSPGTAVASWKTLHNSTFAINEGYSHDYDAVDYHLKKLNLVSKSPPKPHNLIVNVNHKHRSLDISSLTEEVIVDIFRVSPEDLASQLTLIDLPIFAQIQPEELLSCGWSSAKKLQVSPNIVAFTSRFNRVSFWVVQEILAAVPLKQRAEVLGHFIKVAKRLHELNNLHSTYAVISALTSAPIHRLNKTWNLISKKNKETFERLNQLFSDKQNFEQLREHLSNAKTPCIPYLGMYLRDIVYIDIAHPATCGLENPQRQIKLDNILRIISEFQRSSYEYLPVNSSVQKYLLSVRYIEELQKFLEDDNYKLSLKLEPPENDSRLSVFYLRDNSTSRSSYNEISATEFLSPDTHSNQQLNSHLSSCSMPGHTKNRNFIPTHRKAHSLGTNVLTSLTNSLVVPPNTSCVNYQKGKNRCLIDDSVLHDDQLIVPKKHETSGQSSIPIFEIVNCFEDDDDIKPLKNIISFDDYINEETILIQGPVKRKTVMKCGKKPNISAWIRYWIALRGSNLFYFDSKCIKSCQRSEFRSNPSKVVSLRGWVVVPEDPTQLDCFTLSDPTGKNVYKFKTYSKSQAIEWCKLINQVSQGLNRRSNSFGESLIDFS